MTHSPPISTMPVGAAAVVSAPEPPPSRPRLIGIDAARGVALFGMMAVHSLANVDEMGRPTMAYSLAAGRAAALFAVLAGVGIAFTTGRASVRRVDARSTAAMLTARAAVIGAIGLALGNYTEAEYGVVILPFYAVLFVLAIPLVFLTTRALAVVGVLIATGVPALTGLLAQHFPEPLQENPSLDDLVGNPLRWLIELTMIGEFPALPWLAYLCAGLLIGRLRLSSVKVSAALLLVGTALAVGANLLSYLLLYRLGGFDQIVATQKMMHKMTPDEINEILAVGADGTLAGTVAGTTSWWLAIDAPHTSTPLDLFGTIGTSAAMLGAMLLLGHLTRPRVQRALSLVLVPLAAAGSMTLTLYTLHMWFINSPYDKYSANTGYLLQVLAFIGIGLAFRATTGRGPLEAFTTMVANRARRSATRHKTDAVRVGAAVTTTSGAPRLAAQICERGLQVTELRKGGGIPLHRTDSRQP